MTKAILFVLLLYPLLQNGQTTAIGLPAENIIVDGHIKDWSSDYYKYNISNWNSIESISTGNISAQFMTAYDLQNDALYFAIEVLDDEPCEQDELLVYLDTEHNLKGGFPFYLGLKNSDFKIVQNSTWAKAQDSLRRNDIEYAFSQSGNRSYYELKIKLDIDLKIMDVLGLDFFLIDVDKVKESEEIILWKAGASKSLGSEKLGHLVLSANNKKYGRLDGQLVFPDSLSRFNRINIISSDSPKFWIDVPVDTSGNFNAQLPVGRYYLEVAQLFTSPLYSGNFNQNSRRYIIPRQEFEILGNQIRRLNDIIIELEESPKLTSKRGWLFEEDNSIDDLDLVIKQWKNYLEIPGISMAVIKDNEVVYDKSWGVKSIISKEAVDESAIFEAASITKSIFAIMVLLQVEKGLIDLDTPLYTYLPFPNIAHDENSKLITARLVLGHQSGLPNWAWGGPGAWESGVKTDLIFKPGSQFGYSGEAFNYLGRVIEKLNGKGLNEIFQSEIAKPLKLTNTFLSYQDHLNEKTCIGHYQKYPCFKRRESYLSPASSLQTNAHDFKRVLLTLMRKEYFSKEIYEIIANGFTLVPKEERLYDSEVKQYVSQGFFIQETSKGKVMAHGGNNGDYDCKFEYFSEKKCGYVIFTNSNLGDEFLRELDLFLIGTKQP